MTVPGRAIFRKAPTRLAKRLWFTDMMVCVVNSLIESLAHIVTIRNATDATDIPHMNVAAPIASPQRAGGRRTHEVEDQAAARGDSSGGDHIAYDYAECSGDSTRG